MARQLAAFAALAALVLTANAAPDTDCLHTLELTETTYETVEQELNDMDLDCFTLKPSNSGFLFQLDGNDTYTAGVKFDHCNEFGGCRCQNFRECDDSEECDCFTPYLCEDNDERYRCFDFESCEYSAARSAVVVEFNKPCVPTIFNSAPGCETPFEQDLGASLATCVRDCRFDDNILVVEDTRIYIGVRLAGDVDEIIDCINNQYVGVNDCFAVNAWELGGTTTTSTTSTTTSTTTAEASAGSSAGSSVGSSFVSSSAMPSSFGLF